jgi:hypothetical protein
MTRLAISSFLAGWVAFFGVPTHSNAEAAATRAAPEFQEVQSLIRKHLVGINDTELNRAAVEGLISELGPKVSLVTNSASGSSAADVPLVAKSIVFDDTIAYVRINRVADGLANAVREACGQLSSTNKLKGLVLDLRYAGGDDYASAAAVADLFARKAQPLLNWGSGVAQSKEKSEALISPVAVLVNRQTAGAAEALAAVLRETGNALLLGNTTAGQAMIAQEFALKNGESLRIATAPVELGNGSALAGGVKPDIKIEVSSADEKKYYADAFRALAPNTLMLNPTLSLTNQPSGTNQVSRRRPFNEAELVRERREGINPDAEVALGRAPEPEKPTVRDPALTRALDLLKGLAVVRQAHAS